MAQRFVPFREEVAHLLFRHGNLEPTLVYELGGIAQLIVQRRPYLQGFGGHRYQQRLVNPFADHPAVSPGGLAPDDPLVDDHDIPAGLGQEIS